MTQDVSELRNAAREYSNAFHRWVKAPTGSDREIKLYSQMTDKIVTLGVIIAKHPAPKIERDRALVQGLNHNQGAIDFLTKMLQNL